MYWEEIDETKLLIWGKLSQSLSASLIQNIWSYYTNEHSTKLWFADSDLDTNKLI